MSTPDTTKLREAVLRALDAKIDEARARQQWIFAGKKTGACRREAEAAFAEFSASLEDADPPKPEHKPHNPDGLTPEQVGVADGWRLLDEDEIWQGADWPPYFLEIEMHSPRMGCFLGNSYGNDHGKTYRTKWTRAELAAKRKEGQ